MGLLPEAMMVGLATGKYAVDHVYLLSIPEDSAGTGYGSATIHNLSTGNDNVIDHGVMVREGYNRSIATPGNLRFGEYKFQLANHDGLFNPDSDIWIHGTTGYVAEAHECLLTRWTSVRVPGSAFQLVPGTLYKGKVDRVEYINKNFNKFKSATFFCTPISLEKLTEKTWGEDDFIELELIDNSALNLTFSAPLPENN